MQYHILRKPAVLAQYGKSKSAFYRDIQDGLFTKPIHLGPNTVGWPASEVSKIVAARITGLRNDELRQLVSVLEHNRKSALQIAGA